MNPTLLKVLLYLGAALSAYLICSVNPAIILSKAIYHQDIRTLGSHNAGFTNFKRCFGGRHAWFVFFLDIAKSLVPCIVFGLLFRSLYDAWQLGVAFTGFFGMLGHAYPIWYRFQGGKAFLVYVATVFMVDWRVGLIAFGLFLLLLFTVKYMSLASLSTALSAPVALFLFDLLDGNGSLNVWVLVLCLLCALLLVFRHKANIVRLIHGEEKKFSLFGKSKQPAGAGAPAAASEGKAPASAGHKQE